MNISFSIHAYPLFGLTLNEYIVKLSDNSDAYIEAVLYGRFAYKYNINQIKLAIADYRKL